MLKRWPIGLGIITGLVALFAGLIAGDAPDEKWQLAARWTGRASFPLFIITFVASSLATLFPKPWTRRLLQRRRWWGLGFAACFFIHLFALCVYNWRIDNFPPTSLLSPGVLAYTLLLAMVLTSNATSQRVLGHRWKWLHRSGMWVFLLIFGRPGTSLVAIVYMLVSLAALSLRLAAWWKTRQKHPRSLSAP